MKIEILNYSSNKKMVLDSEVSSFEDIERVWKSQSSYMSRETKNLIIQIIETSKILTKNEKVHLERKMFTSGLYSRFNLLRQSLYNLVMIDNKGVDGFFPTDKLASVKTLKEDGVIFSIEIEETIKTPYGDKVVKIKVYRLTEYAKNSYNDLIKNGRKFAQKEKERLEKIGY